MRQKRLFNDGWQFIKTPAGTQKEALPLYAEAWTEVDVPHDWLIYDTRALYESSTGWYRKKFFVHNTGGSRHLLRFGGIYMDSTVYINGKWAGDWKYGYSTFEFDVTELLKPGENEALVQVRYQSPNSRWYSGAGIYRNVWWKTVPENHIVSDGIYVSARKKEEAQTEGTGSWQVRISTELAWKESESGAGSISSAQRVTGESGHEPEGYELEEEYELEYEIFRGLQSVRKEKQKIVFGREKAEYIMEVKQPALWSPKERNLYRLQVTLRDTGKREEDREQTAFGFRSIQWLPDKGFFLNGVKVKLHGVCEHHDFGCLGAAYSQAAMRRKLETLRKMGVNAIRTSHNMPAEELMELADEMGFFVVSEAFDMWEKSKTEYDYARFFKEWAAKDVAAWVRRDRNHPSIIMWSIGNEIHDTHVDSHGQEITRLLMQEVLRHDPEKNGAVTIGSNYMPWENAQKCADIVKMAGYNYAERYYDRHHREHPDWVIYGSETSSVVQSRGIYHFPLEQPCLTEDDEQCSALGNSTTSWGAKSPEYCIYMDRDAEYSPGQFIWTGHDYIGEPTPYQTKNSYFGQIDTAGFPKDSYYIYQAEWTDYKINPMVHIFPYWDFNEGQMIDIRVCSNAPSVEIFVNEQSMGITQIDHAHGKELLAHVKAPYQKGTIRAVAYNEEGRIIAEDYHVSFGDSAKITLKADRNWLRADGEDMIFVEIGMEDKAGNPVENAADYVEVTVTGAGRLLGLDNGDSTDYDQYKGTRRKLFNGRLLAVIGAKTAPGPIGITVTDIGVEEDIAPETLSLQAVAAPFKEGISARTENEEMPLVTGADVKIPVRKIEIQSTQGRLFTEEKKEMFLEAVLYPEDATDRKVNWSVVNDAGIPTNLAKITDVENTAAGSRAKITALGDGSFRVRCASANGTDKIKLISQLEFQAQGLGEAFLNPYEFVAGGLYDIARGDVSGYNERGVGTGREGETCVGYSGVDFGSYGSDEITVPIFAMSDDKFFLQIWEGIPGEEGSQMLADVVYQKPCIWDVYQPVTYKLNRRIKGISTVCFATHGQKLFIKGFVFKKYNRALERLEALENSRIYGDTYALAEDAVTGIGNNVSLEYDNMDFGDRGITAITICGRTPLPQNTIHIRFFDEDGRGINQLVEFPHTLGYEEHSFPLECIKGSKKVVFVFLPGCEFDFKWFKFS